MRKTPGQHFQLSEESCSPREKIVVLPGSRGFQPAAMASACVAGRKFRSPGCALFPPRGSVWSAPKREKTLSLLAARLRKKNKLRRAESVPRGKVFFLLLIGNREICCLP